VKNVDTNCLQLCLFLAWFMHSAIDKFMEVTGHVEIMVHPLSLRDAEWIYETRMMGLRDQGKV